MKGAARATMAAAITATLVAGGAIAWPYLEPYANDAAQTVQAYGTELSEAVADGLVSGPDDRGSDPPRVEEAPQIDAPKNPLLDDLRGPLSGPSSPPDLSGEVGAQDWEASFALSALGASLGGATIDLDGLFAPSADARALTQTLTAGSATEEILDSAANQVVVRVAASVDHASDVLGPAVVAALLTELTADPLGAPVPGQLVIRQIDAYFQAAWMVILSQQTLDAVLTLNSDTFGAFGVNPEGQLRPVVDLTYEGNGDFRVPVRGSGIEATLWHELGHGVVSLAQRLNHGQSPGHWTSTESSIQSHLTSVIGAAAWADRSELVSRYAAENVNEFVAECFAEYLGSDNPRPVAQAVVGEFLQSIRQAPEESVATWMGG